MGAWPPNVNFGLTNISETTRVRRLTLKTPLDMVKYPFWVQKNFALGSARPNVNLGPFPG